MNRHPSWSPRNRWREVRKLRGKVRTLRGELEELDSQGMGFAFESRGRDREVEALHDFIRDVRLGIRDLDEYEAVCGPAYL